MTDLNFFRRDLLHLGTISGRNTIALFPVGKKGKQKVAIGDDTGSVHCFEFAGGDNREIFKHELLGNAIACLCSAASNERVYLSEGSKIIGLKKKGQEVVQFVSSSSEPVRFVLVDDNVIFVGHEFVLSVYEGSKEVGSCMSNGKINDMCVCRSAEASPIDSICALACNDRCIRLIRNMSVISEYATNSSVSSIAMRPVSSSFEVIFGTKSGQVSCMRFTSSSSSPIIIWSIQDKFNSPISLLHVYFNEKLIVVCSDGQVSVLDLSGMIQFQVNTGEMITGIASGYINHNQHREFLLSCLSGLIMSWSSQDVHLRDEKDKYGRSVISMENDARIRSLQDEVNQLKAKKDVDNNAVTSIHSLVFHTDVRLNPINNELILTIECSVAMDIVLLSSQALSSVNISDSSTLCGLVTCENSWMIQVSPNTCRLSLSLAVGPIIDSSSEVTITVSSASVSSKRLIIKPLYSYQKVQSTDVSADRFKYIVTGGISCRNLHDMLSRLFNDVSMNDNEMSFKDVFGLNVIVSCVDGRLEVQADSPSVLAIIQNEMNILVNQRRLDVNESIVATGTQAKNYLTLLTPLLTSIMQSSSRSLVAVIKESIEGDGSSSWLSPDLRSIIEDDIEPAVNGAVVSKMIHRALVDYKRYSGQVYEEELDVSNYKTVNDLVDLFICP